MIKFLEKLLKKEKLEKQETGKESPLPKMNFGVIRDKYIETNEFSDVIDLYWLLFSEDPIQRDDVIQLIHSKMSNTKHMTLINYDKQFRTKTSFNWWYNWKEQDLDFLDTLVEEDVLISILGITTFHPNGYLREKALKKLSFIRRPEVIPYMIIRLNDWVGVINKIAIDYLGDIVSAENIVDCIGYFDMFKHIENYQRSSSIFLVHKIEKLIGKRDNLKILLGNINHYSDYVKIIIYRKAADIYSDNIIDYINLVTKERSGYVQGKILPRFISNIENDIFENTYDAIVKSKSFKVREATLIKLVDSNEKVTFDELSWGLLDPSKAVRETTRYYCKKFGYENLRSFYYDNMNVIKTNAVVGLCEVATQEDYEYLYNELDRHRISVTRKIMRILSEINCEATLNDLYVRLQDQRLGISSEARRILMDNKNDVDYGRVFEIYENTTAENVIRNAVMVLLGAPKWKRIRYILHFKGVTSDDIKILVNNSSRYWLTGFNNSFTEPTKDEREKIQEEYIAVRESLTKNERLWFEKLLGLESMK